MIKTKSFSENEKLNSDLFMNPIDISDNTISNGNSIMLTNLTRLGLSIKQKNSVKALMVI